MPKKNEKSIRCSFCGKAQEEVKKIIAGPGVYICDECIKICQNIIDEEIYDDIEEEKVDKKEIPNPAEIKKTLDEYVIGQEEAKKSIYIAV